MSPRLSDEQIAWMVGYSDRDAEIPTLAREVQMWRALVNGGPCGRCGGSGNELLGMYRKCSDCTDGTRPGLIARLERVDHGLSSLRTNEEAIAKERLYDIIDDLRRAVGS